MYTIFYCFSVLTRAQNCNQRSLNSICPNNYDFFNFTAEMYTTIRKPCISSGTSGLKSILFLVFAVFIFFFSTVIHFWDHSNFYLYHLMYLLNIPRKPNRYAFVVCSNLGQDLLRWPSPFSTKVLIHSNVVIIINILSKSYLKLANHLLKIASDKTI